MEALFTSVSTVITKMIGLLGIVSLELLKNKLFLLIIGIVVLGIIINIVFTFIKKTFYYNGKRIKGYAYWRSTGPYEEMGNEPVKISRKEYKIRKKRGEDVTYILDADEDIDFDEEFYC